MKIKKSRISYLVGILRTMRLNEDLTVQESMAVIDVENILVSLQKLGALTAQEVEDEY